MATSIQQQLILLPTFPRNTYPRVFPEEHARRPIDFMRNHGKNFSLLMSVCFIAATATAAFAQSGKCSFQQLNFPPPATNGTPVALNDLGGILGQFTDSAGQAMKQTDNSRQTAFLWLLIKSMVLLACSSGNTQGISVPGERWQ